MWVLVELVFSKFNITQQDIDEALIAAAQRAKKDHLLNVVKSLCDPQNKLKPKQETISNAIKITPSWTVAQWLYETQNPTQEAKEYLRKQKAELEETIFAKNNHGFYSHPKDLGAEQQFNLGMIQNS